MRNVASISILFVLVGCTVRTSDGTDVTAPSDSPPSASTGEETGSSDGDANSGPAEPADTGSDGGTAGDGSAPTEPPPLPQETTRRLLHEVFTGSNCKPCVEADSNIEAVAYSNPGLYTMIKYQVGSDPYISAEGVQRRLYYLPPGQGSYKIPYAHADGIHGFHPNEVNDDQGYLQSDFEAWQSPPAHLLMNVQSTVSGQTVTIEGTVTALQDFPSENLVIHLAIIEWFTLHNIGINGQEAFHHVMKKMVPDADGSPVGPLTRGDVIEVSESYTFQGDYAPGTTMQSPVNHAVEHTVEHFEHLSVVAWIQDTESTQVHQSTWDYPDDPPDYIP